MDHESYQVNKFNSDFRAAELVHKMSDSSIFKKFQLRLVTLIKDFDFTTLTPNLKKFNLNIYKIIATRLMLILLAIILILKIFLILYEILILKNGCKKT